MLDTSTCILLMNRSNLDVSHRAGLCVPGELCMSSITEAELEFGVANSGYRSTNHEVLVGLRALIGSLPFDTVIAIQYGSVRADLERRGRMIGPLDALIAAHALALDLTLVTDNTREFRRVKQLRLENWARPTSRSPRAS